MKVEVFACDFCSRTQHQVQHLIAGPKTAICDECIDQAAAIIAQAMEEEQAKSDRVESPSCGS